MTGSQQLITRVTGEMLKCDTPLRKEWKCELQGTRSGMGGMRVPEAADDLSGQRPAAAVPREKCRRMAGMRRLWGTRGMIPGYAADAVWRLLQRVAVAAEAGADLGAGEACRQIRALTERSPLE